MSCVPCHCIVSISVYFVRILFIYGDSRLCQCTLSPRGRQSHRLWWRSCPWQLCSAMCRTCFPHSSSIHATRRPASQILCRRSRPKECTVPCKFYQSISNRQLSPEPHPHFSTQVSYAMPSASSFSPSNVQCLLVISQLPHPSQILALSASSL